MITSERLATEARIRELIALYPRLADAEKMDECSALFARDGVFTVAGQTAQTPAGIAAFLKNALATTKRPMGTHFTSNIVIELRDHAWHAETNVMYVRGEAGEWKILVVARYLDRFVEEDGHLRFARREILLSTP